MTETLRHCPLCFSSEIEEACALSRMSRCNMCALVFDNPRPSEREIFAHYAGGNQCNHWLLQEPERNALWKRRLRMVKKHRAQGRLLDVGAGIGQFLHFARAAFAVDGSEISPAAIRIAESKYGLKLREGAIEDLTWPYTFDVITMFHVLEHLPFPGRTLHRCAELLNDQGVLVVAVPNDIDSFRHAKYRLMRRLGRKGYQHLGIFGLPPLSITEAEVHLSHFQSPVLARALQEAGFEVIEQGPDPSFAELKSRWLFAYQRYYFHRVLQYLTGHNFYSSLWMVARRMR